jgi:DHA1 family tetracycline resistance protein-like MFS transporter
MRKFLGLLKGPMGFIIATMFLNFAGLTIIIPVIPYIVARYTNDVALYVGIIMSVAALCQFIASPVLGYLSDIYGRRPILLWSLLGGMVGFIVFGIGGALWVLFLARIIDGATAGDTPAMYAYIADVSKPAERARLYGILGAAGGVGFIVGPAIGGFAAQISLSTPLYVAAALSLVNAIWGYFVMPESLKEAHRVKKFEAKHLNPLQQFKHVFTSFTLRVLFITTFLFFTALIMQQSNISVFLKEILHWGPTQIGIVLTVVGVIDILSQGYLTGKLLPLIGETPLALIGLTITALGMILLGSVAFVGSGILLYVAVIVYTLGDGLFEPAMSGLISNATEPHMQGRIQGANQGTQSIARVVAPLAAAGLYQFGAYLPYYVSAGIMAVTLFILLAFRSSFKVAKQ